jgi:hypothetical protein
MPAPVTLTLTIDAAPAGFRVSATGPHGTASNDLAELDAARFSDALLAGGIGACIGTHRRAARTNGSTLRIVVRSDHADWPIESLRDATGEDLGMASDVSIVRARGVTKATRQLKVTTPVRVLLVVAEPAGEPPFGGAAIASALEQQSPHVSLTRLHEPTERALDEALRAQEWHVLHIVARGQSRAAARYGTLDLIGSEGRKRSVNAQNVARLCAKSPSLGVVVLQAVGKTPAEAFDVLTGALLESGTPAVVWLPDFGQQQTAAMFARELYGRLAMAEPLDLAMAGARRAFAHGNWSGPVLFAAPESLDAVVAPTPTVAAQPVAAAPEPVATNHAADAEAARRRAVEQALARRRDAGEFDVFLCHNVADKPAVKEIGHRLMEHAVLPWLDEWELRPGLPWQRLLEEQIGGIRAAAVFVGRDGIGPWQRQELDGFLREFVRRSCPVIPVLLQGTPAEPELPRFLAGMTWVDFRVRHPDPVERLIWGITGQRPRMV